MRFEHEGRSYDTSEMETFSSSQGSIVEVCLDRKERRLFVFWFDRLDGIQVRVASETQVRFLAEQMGRPELLEALPLAPRAWRGARAAMP